MGNSEVTSKVGAGAGNGGGNQRNSMPMGSADQTMGRRSRAPYDDGASYSENVPVRAPRAVRGEGGSMFKNSEVTSTSSARCSAGPAPTPPRAPPARSDKRATIAHLGSWRSGGI